MIPFSLIRAASAVALFVAATGSSLAAETAVRRYAIPDSGFLELSVPTTWNEIVRRPPFEKGPPTIVFGAINAVPFEISVTPEPRNVAADKRPPRERVQEYLEGVRPNVVEADIPLVKIENASAKGVYFSATDKAPRPGDYEFLTHGIVETGDLTIAFTILTHKGQQFVVNDAITMLGSAKHVLKE